MSDMFEPLGAVVIITLITLLSRSRGKKSKNRAPFHTSVNSDLKKMTEKKLREETKNLNGKVHGSGHTHDRLDFDCYNPSESEVGHYKKQLDSFLNAGLIEKDEYRELLRKYMSQK